MRSKKVLFIEGPLHGQLMEIVEGNEYVVVQRTDEDMRYTENNQLQIPTAKIRYVETPIHGNIYFLENSSKDAIYERMKAVLWYHKANPALIPDLPLKVTKALALNATIDEAKRKEIIYMTDNV